MITELTPESQRSPFHSTTINLASVLLCVFTTLAVLTSVAFDQSGAAIAEVTTAFNGSLRDHGRKDVAMIAAAFRQAAQDPGEELAGKSRIVGKASRNTQTNDVSLLTSEDEETRLVLSEETRRMDVNEPVFSNLMTELERYSNVSPSMELAGQLRLELHAQVPQSQEFVLDTMERILAICRTVTAPDRKAPAELEIIVWASTPATDALAEATKKAFVLAQSLQKSLQPDSDGAISLSSSGRIWISPVSPRPLATVVVRISQR